MIINLYHNCCNLAEIGSTYNNKYKGIKRESQLVQNSKRADSKRAHTIQTCAHLEYSGIYKPLLPYS